MKNNILPSVNRGNSRTSKKSTNHVHIKDSNTQVQNYDPKQNVFRKLKLSCFDNKEEDFEFFTFVHTVLRRCMTIKNFGG